MTGDEKDEEMWTADVKLPGKRPWIHIADKEDSLMKS